MVKEKTKNPRKADYISLGHHIAKLLCQERTTNEFYEILGKDFCNYCKMPDSPRILFKKLRFNRLTKKLVRYAMQKKGVTNTLPIMIGDDEAHLTMRYINGGIPDLNHEPFFIGDMYNVTQRFIVMDGFESIEKDAGERLLDDVLCYFEDIPIIMQAGYLYYGDYETINEDELSYSIMDNLVEYYKEFGFENINSYIGGYDESRIMLFDKQGTVMNILEPHF